MIRTLICTAALTIIALTTAHAEAGKFKINFGGGGKGHHGISFGHNKHHNNYHHNKYRHNHYHKVYKPAVTCYYQVCFYHESWGYKKHERFTCQHDAEAFAHKMSHLGYWTSVSKTCTPYPSGHIIYNHGHIHNKWLP